MDVVGRQEAPVFTWNPVEQMWVQERGGAAKPPPAPHDIHAIQTWFLDTDDNEWIQTVLGPMGRQLAAHWRGAYRVPDAAISRETKTTKKRNPVPILVAAVVLIALIGGIAVAAPTVLQQPSATATTVPPASIASSPTAAQPSDAPSVSPSAEPSPATPEPATPVPVVAPRRTPTPTIVRPAGPSVKFGNGTTVVYTGPLTVSRGAFLPASFTVFRENGAPGSGTMTVMLGNLGQPLRTVAGPLDAQGRVALQVPATLPAATWPLYFVYEGATVQIASVVVR